MTQFICGQGAEEGSGCGQPIRTGEEFRCWDCSVPYHRRCGRKSFCSSISQEARVRTFHEKFGFSIHRDLSRCADLDSDRDLRVLGADLRDWARKFQAKAELEQEAGDERLYRAHLIVEECGEVLQSLGLRDEVLLADAIGDLQYVTVGTAVTYDIPVDSVFAEIHRSNMTKTRGENDRRMRRKSAALGYTPPNIVRAINEGREQR